MGYINEIIYNRYEGKERVEMLNRTQVKQVEAIENRIAENKLQLKDLSKNYDRLKTKGYITTIILTIVLLTFSVLAFINF